jgi:hypothetical protein
VKRTTSLVDYPVLKPQHAATSVEEVLKIIMTDSPTQSDRGVSTMNIWYVEFILGSATSLGLKTNNCPSR